MQGSIVKRGSGYTVVLDYDRGADGKRRQKWVSGFRTKREAERELARLVSERHAGGHAEPSRLTVAEYLRSWLADRKGQLAARTWERYAEIAEKHLVPALGSRRLAELRPVHVKSYLTAAAESGRRDGRGGLSGTTILQHYRVLAAALHQAVRLELLPRNVCDAVAPPQRAPAREAVLSVEEAAAVLCAIRGTEMYLPVVLALSTGARRGEVCALRWRDCDLRARQVTICRSLEVSRAAGLRVKEPKSRNGIRVAPLLPFAAKALEAHRQEQEAARRVLACPEVTPEDLVVSLPDGQPLHPDTLTRRWGRIADRIGRPEVRLHDLRHSCASFLLATGVPISEVSRILGHASSAFTIDTYGHLLPGTVDRAGQALDASLGAALRGQESA